MISERPLTNKSNPYPYDLRLTDDLRIVEINEDDLLLEQDERVIFYIFRKKEDNSEYRYEFYDLIEQIYPHLVKKNTEEKKKKKKKKHEEKNSDGNQTVVNNTYNYYTVNQYVNNDGFVKKHSEKLISQNKQIESKKK